MTSKTETKIVEIRETELALVSGGRGSRSNNGGTTGIDKLVAIKKMGLLPLLTKETEDPASFLFWSTIRTVDPKPAPAMPRPGLA